MVTENRFRWLALALLIVTPVVAQRAIPIRGDRLSGFVLPVEPLAGELRLSALKASSWTVDDTKRLLLEGDVRILIGRHDYRASIAVVWINRLPTPDGLINQVAVYFDEASLPTGQAGLGVEGRNLLLTGSTRGPVALEISLLEPGPPRFRGIVERGEQRLGAYLKRLLVSPPKLTIEPQLDRPPPPDQFIPVPGGRVRPEQVELPTTVELPVDEPTTLPLFASQGAVHWSAGTLQFVPGSTESTVIADGRLFVEYVSSDVNEQFTQLTLVADRGVIFTDPLSVEELATSDLDAQLVRGIYLEGNVQMSAQDGDYVVRAPRAYYDLITNQAVMVEAVLRTFVQQTTIPIYARAKDLRQVAINQWQAKRVVVSTSEFHTPHLALGAERMTITRQPNRADPQQRETYMDSEDNRLLVSGVSAVGWPRFRGTVRDIPLTGVVLRTDDQSGVLLGTRWDLFSLLGIRPPDGVEMELRADAFTDAGAGLGIRTRYDLENSSGIVELYGMYDDGTDRTSAGRDVDPATRWRGVGTLEHQMDLRNNWSLQAQASWISDPTFITSWREEDFSNRREYETEASLLHQKDTAALTFIFKYGINDYISNSYLLASRAYQVAKMPELTYRRYGDSWFKDSVTYSGETRLGYMRLILESGTPNELGVPGLAFGISGDDSISDSLLEAGYTSSWVGRFDTRHEVSIPLSWRALQLTPFFVGRFTAYSNNIERNSEDGDGNTQRAFGAAGIRLNSQFHHVNNAASNPRFGMNRLRHIFEPYGMLWFGSSNVKDSNLIVYDQQVEPLTTETAVQVGLRNTWQTQRGGPGRWRSVDFLTFDVNAVFNSNDADRTHPTPQFFAFRPEYSSAGEHIFTSLAWLISDSVSLIGQGTYDLDESLVARGSIGIELEHSPMLSTFIEYRFVEAGDNEVLGIRWDYRLSAKYRIGFTPQWDFVEDEFRNIALRITRSFPDFNLIFQVRRDNIRGDTSVGAGLELVEF